MKIAIAGAGISGAYMYRLLKNSGYDVTIFDLHHKNNCGINPCAWGTSKGFEDLVGRTGLNPDDYILHRIDHIFFDEIRIKANLLTIDKPKLIKDLLGDAQINEAKLLKASYYDMTIDATGVARAYLPPIDNDLISPCHQFRMVRDQPAEMHIRTGRVGYAWIFPLSDHEFHVGAGSLVMDPIKILKDMGWLPKANQTGVKCACYSKVRLTAPRGSRPFVQGNIWGIGEAIGCVAPLAGDGIVHSMKSAQLLLENIDSVADYVDAIQHEFEWMEKEREVVERLTQGKMIGIGSARVFQRNTKRMDMKIGIWDALKILWRTRK